MNRALSALLAATCLTGCGGIADNVTTHHITIHTHRAALPLTVAIGGADDKFFREQKLVTDPGGDASAEFRSMWSAALVIIPPLGMIPHRPERPTYRVGVHDQRFHITRDSPNTVYRWTGDHWQTDVTLTVH